MYIAATTDPVVAIRAEARRAAERGSMAARLCRWLVQAWVSRLERRIERAVVRLEHAGVLEELREARRKG
jgi:hypothetical protein